MGSAEIEFVYMTLVLFHCCIKSVQQPRYNYRYGVCQGKCKFGKLGEGKSCSIVYGSTRSSVCKVHTPDATATIQIYI